MCYCNGCYIEYIVGSWDDSAQPTGNICSRFIYSRYIANCSTTSEAKSVCAISKSYS